MYIIYLNSAAAKGNVLRLQSYTAAGADPISTKDMYGRTPLHAVCIFVRIFYVNFCYANNINLKICLVNG